MKYVNFNKVIIRNFLSVGEDPVEVRFNRGLNIITGNNKDKVDRRNGVGKSTIADSVYFAIFGDTLRSLKKEHIINNVTQRHCCVELFFTVNTNGHSDEYHIVRQLAPTKCRLYKGGDDITRDSIQNTTEYVCNLLNTTPDVFQNCVIMTINNATPFMAKKKLEKRKFIEGIFNLQVFSDMLTAVRQEYNQVSRELDVDCARYEEISNTLSGQLEQKEQVEGNYLRAKEKLLARQKVNAADIEKLKLQNENTPTIDVSRISRNITSIDDVIAEVDRKSQSLMTKKGEIVASKAWNINKRDKLSSEHKTCPTCLHDLDDTHKSYIEEEREKLTLSIKKDEMRVVGIEAKLKEASEAKALLNDRRSKESAKLNDANVEIQKRKAIDQQLKQLESQSDDIKDDLRSLDKNNTNFDKILEEIQARLDKTQSQIDDTKKEISKLDVIKFIVSEEGVKAYIVKKILQLFNAKLAHYLKKMDSNCICVFNEYFEEEIIDEKGKPCSYFNFSGAERKNIDLACLFAFMDIRRLQGDVAFNFSMYDELFDSSLDERGVELVIDILKERIEAHDECVMVISHRKESTKLATGEIIFLEKQNGVTKRVETPETDLK